MSDRLPQVIWATRLVLLLVLLGLILVGVVVRQQTSTKHAINYEATFMFVAAWAEARWKSGLRPPSLDQAGSEGWLARAATQT